MLETLFGFILLCLFIQNVCAYDIFYSAPFYLFCSCLLPLAAGNLPVLWSRGPQPVGLSAGEEMFRSFVFSGVIVGLVCAPCHINNAFEIRRPDECLLINDDVEHKCNY